MRNDYGFKKYIMDAITDLGFNDFTAIQKAVFVKWKTNSNILARSKTGSGKTHAFLIPIFQDLNEDIFEVQALIIAPTKELANQIYKMAQHIASFSDKRIDIRLYCGGSDRLKEIERLKNGMPQIAIGTPGKMKDLAIEENILKIYTSKFLIVDEMDMALEDGFMDELDKISSILKDSKMMFFSATASEKILPFVKKYLDAPDFIDIKENEELKIEHIWIPLKHKDRLEMLKSLLSLINPYLAIIFSNKKETVDEVAAYLSNLGFEVGLLHGGLSPRERKRVIKMAIDLKYQYIVASDIAARGIDIDGVSHIINYEIPKDFEFYVHRSGRTGRMNYDGKVYSFYNELDDIYLDNLAKKGIRPNYMEISADGLIPYKGRNTRLDRIKPKTEYEKAASKFVPKSNKVTPNYKKKRQEQISKIAKTLKDKDNWKRGKK